MEKKKKRKKKKKRIYLIVLGDILTIVDELYFEDLNFISGFLLPSSCPETCQKLQLQDIRNTSVRPKALVKGRPEG